MADRRRRRRRASQDSEDEEDSGSGSDSASSASPSTAARGREANPRGREPEQPEAPGQRSGPKSDEESECESEDGVGEAVLSDYDSADPEENGSHSEGGDDDDEEEEEAFTTATTTEETKPPPAQTTPPGDQTTPPRDQDDKTIDKADDKSNVTGERQSGDGQESTDDPETKSGLKQKLDDDEDRKNPAYIPRKGLFFEHDLRGATEEERPKGRNRKLWKDEGRWEHDRFREEEQAPKSREELIAIYGYDIRNGGGGERRRERRSNNRAASPSRVQRYRDTEQQQQRPLRSWHSTAPNNNNRAQQAPPSQPLNQSAAPPFRTRAPPPPRATTTARNHHNNNVPPYRSNEALRPHRERHSQKVALEFTAGGGGVATTRGGGRGFRGGAPPDDVAVGHADLSESAVCEQKPLPLSNPAPPVTSSSSPAPANRSGSPSLERPAVERKSYSLARRTRSRPDKQASVEDTPPSEKPWATAQGEGPQGTAGTAGTAGLSDLDQDLARLSLSQNWSQNPTSYIRSEIRGLTNPLHLSASQLPGSPMPSSQFSPLDEMSSSRAKRYSSQRQRPDPAPLHLHPPGVMETGHYYEPMSYQGPIYAHGDGPAPLPPQGMLVQPEMHLPHPGLHPHQSGGPITNPALYGAPPVSLSPGQPQQLLPPPFYPPPGVMTFPYPAMYPAPPQAPQSQVTYGGVTYYDTVQQQAQPKPSPPRRTSQPVTVKAPPPDLSKAPPPPPPPAVAELPYAASE